MDYTRQISKLLRDYENSSAVPLYGSPEVHIASRGNDVYIVSDLHLTGELNGQTPPSEEEIRTAEIFTSFLSALNEKHLFIPAILVINGDLFDFLRITSLPESESDFRLWQSALYITGIEADIKQLRASITRRELRYGLDTSETKSVWKLSRAAWAHPLLFRELARWMSSGNQIIITKGNHDFELYWPAVRSFIRYSLSGHIAGSNGAERLSALKEIILPALFFADGSLIIDGIYYVEHGHRYDKYTHIIGKPVLKGELNTPFGAYFNRYLFNPIERAYPPLKNIHIKGNILQMLIEKRFFVGLRAFLRHVPVLFLVIPFRYYRHLFGRALLAGLVLFLPLLFLMDKFWDFIDPVTMKLNELEKANPSLSRFLKIPGYNIIGGFILSFFSFVVSRSDVYLTIEEQNSLKKFAAKILEHNPHYRLVTFGHTHNSEYFMDRRGEFYNTGAWIYSAEKPGLSESHTFLHIEKTREPGGTRQARYLRWNYIAGRIEPFSDPAAPGDTVKEQYRIR